MRKMMIALATVVALTGCAKDGEDGQDGKNASVIVKEMFVYSTDWDVSSNPSTATLNVSELKGSTLSGSMVQVYRKEGEALIALPFTHVGQGFSMSEQFAMRPGEIALFLSSSDGTPRYFTGTSTYKVVIAEAGTTKSQIQNRLKLETGLKIVDSEKELVH